MQDRSRFEILFDELEGLREKHPDLLKRYNLAWGAYSKKYDVHMREAGNQFGNQVLRDSAVRGLMEIEPETKEWELVKYEKELFDMDLKIMLTQARLLQGDYFEKEKAKQL